MAQHLQPRGHHDSLIHFNETAATLPQGAATESSAKQLVHIKRKNAS